MSNWREATADHRELLELVLLICREWMLVYGYLPTLEQLEARLKQPGK